MLTTTFKSFRNGISPNGIEFTLWEMEFAYQVKKDEGLVDVKFSGFLTITSTSVEYHHPEEVNLLPDMQSW